MYDADLGEEWNGLCAQSSNDQMEIYVWEDGEGNASYRLNKIEGAALRDALGRWINEGGK